jgi:hypothetical protein
MAAFAIALCSPVTAVAAGAANNHTVLILASTVTGGMSSMEAQTAITLGYDVELATDAQWLAKTQAEFESYRALILGDPTCLDDNATIAAAESSTGTWGPAVDGKVVIIGTDMVYHAGLHPEGAALVTNGIGYVLSDPIADAKTGFYVSLSCYYNGEGSGIGVTVLNPFGTFIASDNECHADIHITDPTSPIVTGITDAGLSDWNCSMHAVFSSWPSDFHVVAMGEGLGSAYSAPDGSVGAPYILTGRGTCGELPTISINSVNGPSLWPPNKGMAEFTCDVTVTGDGVVVTREITCNEVPKKPWTVFYEDGDDVFSFSLRHDRNGNGNGRIYTITYYATDTCGNVVTDSEQIYVPHDQSKK